jgi:hypothetical protein
MIRNAIFINALLIMFGCSPEQEKTKQVSVSDTIKKIVEPVKDTAKEEPPAFECKNDSLNALANIMSGITDDHEAFKAIQSTEDFKIFSKNFDKKWFSYDSTRLLTLRNFQANELSKVVKKQSTLFYPFSGPDILYAHTFFPDADRYIMIGLEPVGSFPVLNEKEKDSLENYFNKVNTSLKAILKFSFFRTASMKTDLRNTELDGTIHLLTLFLKRTGNTFCSAKALTVDSNGNVVYVKSFETLKRMNVRTKGVEIVFSDVAKKKKTLLYFSTNAMDEALKKNKGFVTYMKNIGTINTYLKGASYLMHKNYFSIVRNVILDQSEQVIQDDSGIALEYFTKDDQQWDFTFYGQYTKPIPMFKQFYQKDLDSLYDKLGSKDIGFGIGYNFKDKNSNFMIASK